MDNNKLKKTLIDVGRDILIAFTIVVIVMLVLWAYCGIWPPMVVVESGSMQHSEDRSFVGVIDTGDMVFVKTVDSKDDVVTYVDGEATNYAHYGAFGDVVIYRPNGDEGRVPIIHRAVIWLELNDSAVSDDFNGIDYANYTFDIPSLGKYNTTDNIVLENYGHEEEWVNISLRSLITYYDLMNKEPHGGFITMGDNNAPYYDQPLNGSYEPVLPEWIVGKAVGEIPWFGLIKLKVTGTDLTEAPRNSWTNLFVTLFLILLIPFLFDYFAPKVSKKMEERKKSKSSTEKSEIPKEGAAPEDKHDDGSEAGISDASPAENTPLGQTDNRQNKSE
ncbi:MAG: S26 family signal peptidase [Thermoplasmata archaeon]|nr:S26 family signal peptidase [Thermoplasmata archaeon]